jgi:hypothetical protein
MTTLTFICPECEEPMRTLSVRQLLTLPYLEQADQCECGMVRRNGFVLYSNRTNKGSNDFPRRFMTTLVSIPIGFRRKLVVKVY